MFQSIFIKEWLKIKSFLLFSILTSIIILGYFAFKLNFEFSTVEPESMMWYRFVQLEQKPYFDLIFYYLIFGCLFALFQFLPELIQKRVKVTIHLPLNLPQIVFSHIFIGLVFIIFYYSFISLSILAICAHYYPEEIVQIIFKDTLAFSLISIISYILISALILEQNKKILFLKALILVLFLFVFIKEQFFINDFFILFTVLIFSQFILLDSFYSVKQQRLKIFYKVGFFIISFILLSSSFLNYKENYQKEFYKYYIFYSDILEDFVYQKNFGEHRFEYGIKDDKTFLQKEYESYLPFVYWRDLDIQKKLPVIINEKVFTKDEIKDSKLGFDYNYKLLKKQETELYPLFNPQTNEGMIKFPEEFFGIFKDGAKIYDFDNDHLKEDSKELNKKLQEVDFSYPVKNIWGKTTNIKPFDLGYLIIDNKNRLFNLKKENNNIQIKEIEYPKNIDIVYINIAENKQQNLSGYAIDKNSNFYLLTWDFEFIKLDLKEFDYKKMRLKFIADPVNYLIRYDDQKNYYAVIYSKDDYKKIKEINFKD
ncbi:DUF4857 domain-containing protein [Aliarcobacter butzleri]|uniref:DUF4857 domain-containing protein n=1 Tax=Aliarcobacter butzleri TaxID=28197 RepID=UPI00063AC170|nr:DUF4857 domain-containing protein [Aliarcobacter butzleri]KLE08732.1 hypothetical protein AF79_07920 [Aliarcobacter butzleri L354]